MVSWKRDQRHCSLNLLRSPNYCGGEGVSNLLAILANRIVPEGHDEIGCPHDYKGSLEDFL